MRFKPNDTVWHLSTNKKAKIIGIVGGEERRYYVQHSKEIWSVPERFLVPISALKKLAS